MRLIPYLLVFGLLALFAIYKVPRGKTSAAIEKVSPAAFAECAKTLNFSPYISVRNLKHPRINYIGWEAYFIAMSEDFLQTGKFFLQINGRVFEARDNEPRSKRLEIMIESEKNSFVFGLSKFFNKKNFLMDPLLDESSAKVRGIPRQTLKPYNNNTLYSSLTEAVKKGYEKERKKLDDLASRQPKAPKALAKNKLYKQSHDLVKNLVDNLERDYMICKKNFL